MMLSTGVGTEVQKPLASVIIGGIMSFDIANASRAADYLFNFLNQNARPRCPLKVEKVSR